MKTLKMFLIVLFIVLYTMCFVAIDNTYTMICALFLVFVVNCYAIAAYYTAKVATSVLKKVKGD